MTEAFLADHWVPSQEWAPQRYLAACYLTLADGSPLLPVVAAYQRELSALPGLDLVERRWLHVTVQGVEFSDRFDAVHMPAFLAALRDHLAELPPMHLVASEAVLGGSGIFLPLHPAEPVAEIQQVVRRLVRTHLGIEAPYVLPGQDRWPPHLTVAYANAHIPAAEVLPRLEAVAHEPLPVRFDRLSFLSLRRMPRSWEWTDEQSFGLSGTAAARRAPQMSSAGV